MNLPRSCRLCREARRGLVFNSARSMKAKAFPRAAILAALREVNREQCDPPHEDAEVQRALDSAMAQPDRAGFEPRPVSDEPRRRLQAPLRPSVAIHRRQSNSENSQSGIGSIAPDGSW